MTDDSNIPIGPASEEATASDRQFKLMKMCAPIRFGSLWWGRDDLIHEKQPEFVQRADRIGHPLLSVKRDELKDRADMIPMLVGTSGRNLTKETKRECVAVRGIDPKDLGHVSFFGSIVAPGSYGFDDLLDGVIRKKQAHRRPENKHRHSRIVASEPVPWYELHSMQPNHFKPHVDAEEEQNLNRFCQRHGF